MKGLVVRMGFLKFLRDKKGIAIEMLIWLLIGFAVLVLAVVVAMIAMGKGSGLINFIKNILRFGLRI